MTPAAATVGTELAAIAGGNPSTFAFEWKINDAIVEGSNSNRLAVGPFAKGDRVSVTLSTNNASVSDATEILNSLPVLTATQFVEPRLHAGVDIEIAAETTDADGDPVSIRYSWTLNGEVLDGKDESILPGSLLHRGDRVSFTALPNDGEADGPAYVANEFIIPNGAPRFVSTYPLQFSNFVYRYPAQAEDPDGDPLLYQLESGPTGMTIDRQSGDLHWEIQTSQGGEHRVKIIAEDTEGLQATQEFALAVKIPEEGIQH
jgi:hypothetical protein